MRSESLNSPVRCQVRVVSGEELALVRATLAGGQKPEVKAGRTISLRPRIVVLQSRAPILAALMTILCVSAWAQSSVTLDWNPVTNSPVQGYRLYQGTNSGIYTDVTDAGNTTQQTVELAAEVTYFFAVADYDANGVESPFSTEVSFTVSLRAPPPSLTFAADSGTISSPFIATNGIIYQTALTGAADGGRAVYDFTIGNDGDYMIFAILSAPNSGDNSFFINMDAEPTDPTMIWDIAPTTGFENRTVSWRGNGTVNNSQFSPKIFTLSAGMHQLIVRGREPNTQLSTIAVTPAYAKLQISALPGQGMLLSGVARIGQAYELQATQDLQTWTVIQTLTTDNRGEFAFIDTAALSLPARCYRLRETAP